MPHHSLTNFEIQKYYQNQHKFNGVYSSIDLIKIKDAAYVVTLKSLNQLKLNGWLSM